MSEGVDMALTVPPPPETAEGDVQHVETRVGVEVELPTIGRIVHFRIDPDDSDTLRPALVLGHHPSGDGVLVVQVFLHGGDLPYASGTHLRKVEAVGGFFAIAAFGPECGEWRWPARDEPEFFVATA